MSDRSDYIRCVSGPYEAQLRARIAELEQEVKKYRAEQEQDEEPDSVGMKPEGRNENQNTFNNGDTWPPVGWKEIE